jgi:hypothetical protein
LRGSGFEKPQVSSAMPLRVPQLSRAWRISSCFS